MVAITRQTLMAEIVRQQNLARSIANDQQKISSGKKVAAPSDDAQTWVQISDISRQQSNQAAWNANVVYAKSRSEKAESNLTQLNSLFTRARELIVEAASTAEGEPGRDAIAADLEGIRKVANELLNETDFQGTPVFDDSKSILVPVARGLSVEAVGTRQSVSDGVQVDGQTLSLDQILENAINGVKSGTQTDRDASLSQVREALDHVILAQSVQGVRASRLDDAGERLSDADLQLASQRSELEDTDLTETITKLQAKLVSLEAAQAAFARINGRTLFDLLT